MIQRLPEQSSKLPTIRTVEGHELRIDECGVIYPTRYWPPGRPPQEAEIRLAMKWLEQQKSIKLPDINSYGIKEIIEVASRCYLTNGSVIIAADRLGLRLSHRGEWKDGPNCGVAISKRSYDRARGARRRLC